jgi:TPR repeat protein
LIRALVLGLALFLAAATGVRAQDMASFGPDVTAALEQLRAGDSRGAVAVLKSLVGQDRDDARVALGLLYYGGVEGLEQDGAKACALWSQAAARRGDAAHFAAECDQNGYAGARDAAKARTGYRAAIALGHVKSQCALGNMLVAGEGGAVDVAGGMRLCRQAAEAGDRDAQTDVGDYYLFGKVVTRDPAEARRWYELAAAQGQRNAAFTLGQIYWNADGVAKDQALAATFWRLAYAKGRKDAAPLLGMEAFTRVQSDGAPDGIDRAALDEALGWYEKAEREDPASRERIAEPLSILRALKKALP